MLDLTVAFWSIAVLVAAAGVAIGLLRYVKERYRHVLYASLGLASQMAYLLFTMIAQLLTDTTFFYIAVYANMPMGLFAILLVDSMSSDHADAKKAALYVGIIVPVFLFALEPGAIFIDPYQVGGPGIVVSTKFLITFFFSTEIMDLLYLLYNTKIHVNAPRNLKRVTWLYLGSSVLYSIVAPAITIIFSPDPGANGYLIPSLCYFLGAAGGAITVIILALQPKLAYILPFKVVRLTVFETSSGIMLYNHTWRTKEDVINDELFSAMLQGIGLIVDEAVKKGTLEELVVTEGRIILKRSTAYPVAFVLVASKTSRALRAALDNFAALFTAKYEAFLNGDARASREVSHFQDAGSLVEACFPFLPEYS